MARFKRAYPRSIYIRQGPVTFTAQQAYPFVARNPVPGRARTGFLGRSWGGRRRARLRRLSVRRPQSGSGPRTDR